MIIKDPSDGKEGSAALVKLSVAASSERKEIPSRAAAHFPMAKPYFTHKVYFTNPVRDFFHRKKDFTKVKSFFLERMTRLELATSTLARWRSTR